MIMLAVVPLNYDALYSEVFLYYVWPIYINKGRIVVQVLY